jgi:hypothetical protein
MAVDIRNSFKDIAQNGDDFLLLKLFFLLNKFEKMVA